MSNEDIEHEVISIVGNGILKGFYNSDKDFYVYEEFCSINEMSKTEFETFYLGKLEVYNALFHTNQQN